ncbi:MAG TPA: CocE/NonD family hydrolase [Mycobacteriales bacterium]
MHRRPLLLGVAAALVVGGAGSAYATTTATAAPITVSKTTLHFKVDVGPGGTTTCDVVGDLYRPSTATPSHRVPVILTTNGFGGSKDDQAYIGEAAAQQGYATLSYSGLGFGGSGCTIELDNPQWDGEAASQLVSFLGGERGIGFTDAGHTIPAPVPNFIELDNAAKHDPRVGMVGGSYGGEVQFAAASVDPRIDAIVPMITWNDLSYSLTPNDTDLVHGVTSSTPGVPKLEWSLLFSGLGVADGVQGAQSDPSRLTGGCPNFDPKVCPGLVEAAALGYPTEPTTTFLRQASVSTYMSKIHVPTLLIQGEDDTLFNLQEATATYNALKAQGTPVSMLWQSWGHSDSTPAPGEFSSDPNTVFDTYEGQQILNWFNHYLKGSAPLTVPKFAYYRDYVPYSGHGPDTAQWATVPDGVVPAANTLLYMTSGDLEGGGKLTFSKRAVTAGTSVFTGTSRVPTSYSETSAVQSSLPAGVPPQLDTAGSFVAYSTAQLPHPVTVAGIPSVTLHLSSPTGAYTQFAGPAGMVEFFAKLYDVDSHGTPHLINALVAPVRVGDITQPVTVQLPGIVHRFPTGDRIQLVLSASDAAYSGGTLPTPVLVQTSPAAPGVISLPVVP